MSDLIPKNTDEEMERYMEADMVRRARIPMEGNAALKFEHDPVTKRENAYFPLSSGGYVKIGDRAVTPEQAAETDVLAAEREIQNDARGPIGDVIGGAGGPTMEDYEAAGFTEAEVVQFQAQEQARVLGQPGIEVPVQLTEEQMQFGEEVGAPMLRATPGSEGAPLDFEMPPPGALERLAVAVGKGLVEGTVVSPLQFVLDTFGVQEPQIVQDLDQALQLDEDAGILLEQLPKGIAQFFGPFAAVGKLLRLGRGFMATMGRSAAADFLGFEGNEGRLTDVLLEFGLPPNAITEMLRTDPNDPEYIGRIKNAAEGALLGIPIEAVARVVGALRSGSAKELEGSLSEMQQGAQLPFRQRINNLTSDFVGAARATGRMDPDMMREIFQRGGQPRSLGAAGTGVDDAALVGRTEDFLGQAAIIRPDDVYRGEGTPRITVRETNEPFVARGTKQNQIDDMIQSGLVRPRPGGYKGSSQLYFGETDKALPTDPLIGVPTEEHFVLVGDSNKLAGTEGPIPIDQLRHVWVVRDGETVDILPEILRANREFDQAVPNATNTNRDARQTTARAEPDPETAGAITAFHGSPYDFDAFDISRMGTGEGAQVYGPGLYFAESEDVAREYRDALSRNLQSFDDPPRFKAFGDQEAKFIAPNEAQAIVNQGETAIRRRIERIDDEVARLREQSASDPGIAEIIDGMILSYDGELQELDTLLREGFESNRPPRGRLYEVNIRANPEDFLNWDAPISQQSEKVRETLMPFVEQRIAQMGEAGNRFTPEQWMDRLRGGDVMLLDKVGDTPVSRAMIEAGIPGVRYLDQASRRGGEGTRNIVVFDDQLIDIVKKYGVAGLAVGAAVQSDMGIQDQIEDGA